MAAPVPRSPRQKGRRLLMLTANAEMNTVSDAMQLGISGDLVKPVSLIQLRKHADRILTEMRADHPSIAEAAD